MLENCEEYRESRYSVLKKALHEIDNGVYILKKIKVQEMHAKTAKKNSISMLS